MKISRPNRVKSSSVRRKDKSGSSSSSGAEFAVTDPDSSGEAPPIAGAGPVTAVGALLSVQEVPDATSGSTRSVRRGIDLLDILDQVRMGLLLGTIPILQLQRLVDNLKQRREGVLDPGLEETLREIETRAAVELAKFDQIRDQY